MLELSALPLPLWSHQTVPQAPFWSPPIWRNPSLLRLYSNSQSLRTSPPSQLMSFKSSLPQISSSSSSHSLLTFRSINPKRARRRPGRETLPQSSSSPNLRSNCQTQVTSVVRTLPDPHPTLAPTQHNLDDPNQRAHSGARINPTPGHQGLEYTAVILLLHLLPMLPTSIKLADRGGNHPIIGRAISLRPCLLRPHGSHPQSFDQAPQVRPGYGDAVVCHVSCCPRSRWA
jgi:hypothetical protein